MTKIGNDRFFIVMTFLVLISCVRSLRQLRGNETEMLAFQALQCFPSMPSQHQVLANEIKFSVRVKAIPNLFSQQQGIQPPVGSYQLENFGALTPWDNIQRQLKENPNQRLLIMIRHGQAWENLNPTSNSNCEFTLNGEVIQNFDSPLTPTGYDQAAALNNLFRSRSTNTSDLTWFETLGFTQESSSFVTSPLSRTMQTTETVFASLPLPYGKSFIASELIRATIGRDVCNVRKSVQTPTSATNLPYPWKSGCKLPDDSLEEAFANSSVRFSFPVRPVGGNGFGLISDSDQLWRADVADDVIIQTRATAFFAQLYESTAPSSVIAIVTHGEMVSALYEAAGEAPYSPKNTEVVPLLVKFY